MLGGPIFLARQKVDHAKIAADYGSRSKEPKDRLAKMRASREVLVMSDEDFDLIEPLLVPAGVPKRVAESSRRIRKEMATNAHFREVMLATNDRYIAEVEAGAEKRSMRAVALDSVRAYAAAKPENMSHLLIGDGTPGSGMMSHAAGEWLLTEAEDKMFYATMMRALAEGMDPPTVAWFNTLHEQPMADRMAVLDDVWNTMRPDLEATVKSVPEAKGWVL